MSRNIPSGIVARLFVVLLFISVTALGITFSIYLALAAHTLTMYLVAVSFALLTLVSGIFNSISAYTYYRSAFYDAYLEKIKKSLSPMKNHPAVAIAIPVYNEDPAMLDRNLARLEELNYEKSRLKYYVVDDSTKEDLRCRIEAIAKKHGAVYLHRAERKGFKAGALNNMLKHSNEQFIAVFDADERLTNRNFLKELLPYFQDKRIAFVQTEKRYAKGTFFSDSVDLFDAIFFKFIQPARAINGTSIYAGSCGIIRRSALDAIGGFPEYIIEDTFFSFEADVHSYRSIYIPKVYALGKPVKTFTELMRQQWRYNYGDTQFLFHLIKKRKAIDRQSISPICRIDYMTHGFGLNYLSGVLILFTIVSVMIVFSSFSMAFSVNRLFSLQNPGFTLEYLGISAFILSILMPIFITKAYFNSVSKGLMIFILNFALAFTRLKAALAAVLNLNPIGGWVKGDALKAGIVNAFRKSTVEMVFSAMLIAAGAASAILYNLAGAIWLSWYSLLYISTFIMFFKYG